MKKSRNGVPAPIIAPVATVAQNLFNPQIIKNLNTSPLGSIKH